MRYLPPMRIGSKYWEPIKEQLDIIFAQEIVNPLIATFIMLYPFAAEKEIWNAENYDEIIASAIRRGEVYFSGGKFKGKGNSKISKAFKELGARRERGGDWELEPSGLILEAIRWRRELNSAIAAALRGTLDSIETTASRSRYDVESGGAALAADKSLSESLRAISVDKQMTDEQRQTFRRDYTENMDLYIKGFMKERVIELRSKIEALSDEGYRAEKISEIIVDEIGISKNKAEFLASNETRLMAMAYRQRNLAELGFTRYKWDAIMDAKTRPDHAALEGGIYKYAEPPIADIRRGLRANPGILWNCRCRDLTIVEGK